MKLVSFLIIGAFAFSFSHASNISLIEKVAEFAVSEAKRVDQTLLRTAELTNRNKGSLPYDHYRIIELGHYPDSAVSLGLTRLNSFQRAEIEPAIIHNTYGKTSFVWEIPGLSQSTRNIAIGAVYISRGNVVLQKKPFYLKVEFFGKADIPETSLAALEKSYGKMSRNRNGTYYFVKLIDPTNMTEQQLKKQLKELSEAGSDSPSLGF